jgi:copper ion binding protein
MLLNRVLGMETSLQVAGMTCKQCVESVERQLSQLTGVERALADLEEGKVFVQYDEHQVNTEDMGQAIKQAGYSVVHEHE